VKICPTRHFVTPSPNPADLGRATLRKVNALQVSPFDQYGSTYEIYQLFGGAEKWLQAVDEMQKFLYE